MPDIAFGIWDHIEQRGQPLTGLYEDRLRFLQAADAGPFRGYHVAEHHCTPLGMAPSLRGAQAHAGRPPSSYVLPREAATFAGRDCFAALAMTGKGEARDDGPARRCEAPQGLRHPGTSGSARRPRPRRSGADLRRFLVGSPATVRDIGQEESLASLALMAQVASAVLEQRAR